MQPLSERCYGELNACGLGENSSFAPGQERITTSFALPHACRIKTPDTCKVAGMVFTPRYKEQRAAGVWSWKPSPGWNNHMKRERENRLTVDVTGKDTMIFLELMELIYEDLQNCQASKQIPDVGWVYTQQVCPSFYFPLLTDPWDALARQTGLGIFWKEAWWAGKGYNHRCPTFIGLL